MLGDPCVSSAGVVASSFVTACTVAAGPAETNCSVVSAPTEVACGIVSGSFVIVADKVAVPVLTTYTAVSPSVVVADVVVACVLVTCTSAVVGANPVAEIDCALVSADGL